MAKELSFQERLKAFSEEEQKKADLLPPGPEREVALQKIRQAEAAADFDNQSSPAQQGPEPSSSQ